MTPSSAAISSVAVFCGSRLGADPSHAGAVQRLGAGLASRGVGLVYGGGRIGLMGVLADAVLDGGGRVSGIIPEFLSAREIANDRVTDLMVTDSMHTRKRLMFERADAFLTLPGGLGTFDETIEIITWRQLGLHRKPILIVDIGGWSRSLLAVFDDAVSGGFADAGTRNLFDVVSDVEGALGWLERARTGDAMPGATARV